MRYEKLFVAFQGAIGRYDADKSAGRSLWNGGCHIGIRQDFEGCGGPVERNAGSSRESLSENADGFADLAGTRHKFREWTQTEIDTKKGSVIVGSTLPANPYNFPFVC